MFLSIENDSKLTSKFIKSVTYHLHPSFFPSVVKLTEPPFLLSRQGWGAFVVTCEVEFVDLGVLKLAHLLSFS